MSSMASPCVMFLVVCPLISINWSPTCSRPSCDAGPAGRRQKGRKKTRLTVNGHPEDEERHGVELAAAADGEAKAALAARQLHREVLVVLRQVGVDLLVLLQHHGEEGGEGGEGAGEAGGRQV